MLAGQLFLEVGHDLQGAESVDQIINIILAKIDSAVHPAHALPGSENRVAFKADKYWG